MGDRSWTCSKTGDLLVRDKVLTSLTPAEVLVEGKDFFSDEEDSENPDVTDGLFCIPFPKNRDSSTSTSSDSSNDSCRSREQRRFQSLWSREDLFSVQSAKHPVNHNEVYHVVTQVYGAAQNEIRVSDRIIEINERNVRHKSMRQIDLIWEGLAKASKIKLKLWRWENDGGVGHNVRELKIVFHQADPECPTPQISKLSLSDTGPRKVKNCTWTSDEFIPFHIRIVSKAGIYVCANCENMTLSGEPMIETAKNIDQFRFLIRYFACLVESDDGKFNKRFGFVAKYKENGKYFDISSIITESASTVILKPHVSYHSTSPDERFFIMYEIKDEDDVFESLLYENLFMKFNNDTKKITMQESKAPGPSCRFKPFKAPGPFFLFETFKARGDKPPQVDISCFSDGGRLFAFEPIPEDDCACQS